MKQKPILKTTSDLSTFTGTVGELTNFLEQNPDIFPVLLKEMLHNPDARVRLRMGNAVEKASRRNLALLKPFKSEILAAVPETKDTEVIWHIALLLGYLELEEDELALAVNALFNWLYSIPHKFVKINCLQTLAVLSKENAWLQPEVSELLQASLEHESPAIRARARILLKTLRPAKKR